ncbi:MAG TPA: hypothetical protein VIS30_05910, partial [Candidatus Deferrimicrobiaceae bacterium]
MRKQGLQIAGFAAVVAAIHLAARVTGNPYHLTQLTMSAYYSLVVLGLCIVTGYAGQISIGHAGFFAIGGYLSALLTTHNLSAYKGPIVSGLDALGILTHRPDLYGGEL